MTLELQNLIAESDWWVRSRLSQLNDQATAFPSEREAAIGFLLAQATSFVSQASSLLENGRTLTPDEAIRFLGDLGFIVTSCVRHGVPSTDVRLNKSMEMMKNLGTAHGHPWRDSLYTYVTLNERDASGRFKAFTGADDEQAFIRFTKEGIEAAERASDLLRSPVGCPDETEGRLIAAEGHLAAYQQAVLGITRKKQKDEPAVRPGFFFDFFRDYFPTYSVEGVEWGPPTAANACPVMEIDLLLGLRDNGYEEHIRSRAKNFLPRDWQRLERAMNSRPLLDQILDGNDGDLSPEALVRHLTTRGLLGVARALVSVCRRQAVASSSHWALVVNYLVRPERDRKSREVVGSGGGCPSKLVDPTRGASGMSFPSVWHVYELRAKNETVIRLSRALEVR